MPVQNKRSSVQHYDILVTGFGLKITYGGYTLSQLHKGAITQAFDRASAHMGTLVSVPSLLSHLPFMLTIVIVRSPSLYVV